MPEGSLLCQLKRRFEPTTDSEHSFGRYPNLIQDATLTEPDRGWVADIASTSGFPRASATWPRSSTTTLATASAGLSRSGSTPALP